MLLTFMNATFSRGCFKEMWTNLWKDSAFTHYLRKCPFCVKCLGSGSTEEQTGNKILHHFLSWIFLFLLKNFWTTNTSRFSFLETRVTNQSSTSIVSVIPLATAGPQSRQRRGRPAVCLYPVHVMPVLPPYAEREVTPVVYSTNTENSIENPPPSYEEAIANRVEELSPDIDLSDEVSW